MSDLLGGKEWNKENKSKIMGQLILVALWIASSSFEKVAIILNSLNSLIRVVLKEKPVYIYPCMFITHFY